MLLGVWLFAIEMSRAGTVVSFDEGRAALRVKPFVGTYESADEAHHATIFYEDGRFRIVQDVNRGQAWITADIHHDVFAEPLEIRGNDALLGRHLIQRACHVDATWLEYTEFRSGLFKRFVETIQLHLDRGVLDIYRRRVLERRGLRGLADWSERPHDREAWAFGVNEHLRLERTSPKPQTIDEFLDALGPPCARSLEDQQ